MVASEPPAENVGLHRRAQRDHFVGIQVGVRRALELLFDQLANQRNARRAADQHGFVDLLRGEAGIFHRLPDRTDGAIDHRLDELLELLARDLALVALAAGSSTSSVVCVIRRQRNLGVDDGLANGLHGLAAAAYVDSKVALNVVERDGDQQVVDVVAAEMRVAVGGDDFEDALVQLENRDVEGAAAEIVNRDRGGFLLVETVGQRSGRRFVDQTQDFESGDAAGVFRGLALRVVEVRGHGDDGLGHRRGEVALGIALELAQDERRNLRRRVGLVAQLDAQHFARREVVGQAEREELQLVLYVFDAAAHQALHAVHGALRSLDQVLAGGVADDDLVVLVEGDDRRHEIQPSSPGMTTGRSFSM